MIWPKLKEYMVKGENPGTFGYLRKLNNAADIFFIMVDELKVPKKQTDPFNADKEVTGALLARNNMNQILKGM